MPWLPPYRAELVAHERHLGDLAFGSGNDLLASDAFRRAWSEASLSGWAAADLVEINSVRPRTLEREDARFYHLAPKRSGRVDWQQSVIPGVVPECDICGGPGPIHAVLKLEIDRTTWDGSDLFVPWGTAIITVTERLVDLAQRLDLKNVITTPIEQYRWDPLHRYDRVDPDDGA